MDRFDQSARKRRRGVNQKRRLGDALSGVDASDE
jgi:hypothetical protein